MGITVTVRKEGLEDEVFTDIIGHQVGYSHIQILLPDGGQRIISNFSDITIEYDEEGKANFIKEYEEKVIQAEAMAVAKEAANKKLMEEANNPSVVSIPQQH